MCPDAQALVRFAAHIQQVDMESNGKRVAIDGTPLPYEAGVTLALVVLLALLLESLFVD